VPPPRSLGFRTDLMILQLQGTTVERRDGYRVIRTPHNPTFWWGNCILVDERPAAGELGRWLDVFHAEHPTAAHVAIGLDTVDGVAPPAEELAEHGLRVTRDTVMKARAVHPPAHPNRAATYRTFASDDDWAQQVELDLLNWPDEHDAPAHRAFVETRFADYRRIAESGAGDWYGAFVDGRLRSSLGLFTDGSGVARFQNVGTFPDARGQGLAGTLVEHVSRRAFDELGVETLVMVADPEYVAIRIYRALGFDGEETQLALERRPPGSSA
jgi:ribosomal protein S18 acetylase RimI-like enzyme